MSNNLNFEIKNFGLINEANIELNKINVVGGINSSGKSTASKLLYCLLKANSSNIKEYLKIKIISNIIELIQLIDPDNDKKISLSDDYSDILKIYAKYKEDYLDNEDLNLDTFLINEKIQNFIDFMDLNGNELSSFKHKRDPDVPCKKSQLFCFKSALAHSRIAVLCPTNKSFNDSANKSCSSKNVHNQIIPARPSQKV